MEVVLGASQTKSANYPVSKRFDKPESKDFLLGVDYSKLSDDFVTTKGKRWTFCSSIERKFKLYQSQRGYFALFLLKLYGKRIHFS